MSNEKHRARLQPAMMSFDVFGTLISVRDSSYGAFGRILADAGAHHVDVQAFWEYWEHRNIAHYWDPYRSYREICALSLAETFEQIRSTMPLRNERSLDDQTYLDILAYILQFNGAPSGNQKLEPNFGALQQIVIEPPN